MRKTLLLLTLVLSMAATTNAATFHAKVDSVYICQSKASYAYHAYECNGLARCKHGIAKVTKAQAIKMGYKPCKICYRN
jgi:hypothetical protein